ncbi:MAG TPA: hypothetical protein VF999_04875 [Thermoanaerobaculia bacterium]
MNHRDFLAAFEAGTLPEECFHHRDHVRAAWLLLREEPPAAALARFSSALKRFAAAKGKTRLYHETITWAYLLLINERMERGGRGLDWNDFAESNPDLLTWRPSVLDEYYTSETIGSDLARRVFLLPDRSIRQ